MKYVADVGDNAAFTQLMSTVMVETVPRSRPATPYQVRSHRLLQGLTG